MTKAGGTIKYKGKHLEAGTIEFYPVNGGRTARANIEPDGSFTVSYRKPGDGLPPGEYKVAVISVKEKSPKKSVTTEDGQDDDRAYAQTSGPTINVVPAIYNNIETTPLRQTVTDESPQQLNIEFPKE